MTKYWKKIVIGVGMLCAFLLLYPLSSVVASTVEFSEQEGGVYISDPVFKTEAEAREVVHQAIDTIGYQGEYGDLWFEAVLSEETKKYAVYVKAVDIDDEPDNIREFQDVFIRLADEIDVRMAQHYEEASETQTETNELLSSTEIVSEESASHGESVDEVIETTIQVERPTLPHTGEVNQLFVSFVGVIVLGIGKLVWLHKMM